MTSLRVATVPLPEPVEGSAQDYKNGMDGRFFAALRMTCFATTVVEMYPSHVGSYCHPEEALSAVPGTGRRQADEASTAAWDHARASDIRSELKCGTTAPASTAMRVISMPIATGEMHWSLFGPSCPANEAKGPTMSPRKCVYRVFALRTIE